MTIANPRSRLDVDESTKENAGTYNDLRVSSSPGALDAYRKGVASPFFLAEPRWVPKAGK